ncbi:MAG: lipopolysaccharide kinase InaA family protein [Myxococcota bacterium]
MACAGVEAGGVLWRVLGSDREALTAQLGSVVGDIEAGRLKDQKSGRRKQLYDVRLGDGSEHLLKVNHYVGLAACWRRLRGSKARREERLARTAHGRGLPTPLPVAWGERHRGGRLEACFLLVPRLAGVADLMQLQNDRSLSRRSRLALAAAFGRLARQVHQAGLRQDDFAPNNFLARLGPEPELFVIDFERARMRSGPVPRAACVPALVRLDRRLPEVSNAERWRFLLAYTGSRRAARCWWRELAGLAPRVALEDLAHLRRTTTRKGRRFEPVPAVEGFGWERRDGASRTLRRQGSETASTWTRRVPAASRRRGRELWAMANLLWLRGLAPRPRAWLHGQMGAALVFEPLDDAQRLSELTHPARLVGALEKLLGRLLALGRLLPELTAHEIAVLDADAAHPRLGLLAPERMVVGDALPPESRLREARDRARALLASCGS